MAVINPLAAEFANSRRRPFVIALMAMGYPVGLAGGALSASLLQFYDRRAVFLSGFMLTLAFVPVVVILLPESPSFLTTSRRGDALERLHKFLRSCGQPEVDRIPPRDS